jgi:hypothetical protein
MKIPIKKYIMDESLSWEERYKQLEAHHKEETEWLITELERIRKLASRWGPNVKYNP